MYARVPQAMAQFVLKIEKLSHIMGPTPIPEMARAYGLRHRLWLLILFFISLFSSFKMHQQKNEIYSVAPGENKHRLSFMRDKQCEELTFPGLFPKGRHGYTTERKIRLTQTKYFNAQLLHQYSP